MLNLLIEVPHYLKSPHTLEISRSGQVGPLLRRFVIIDVGAALDTLTIELQDVWFSNWCEVAGRLVCDTTGSCVIVVTTTIAIETSIFRLNASM